MGFESKRIGDELYVYHNGELIYKRWYEKGTNEKREPSILFNKGWLPERINK
jgi:hypothetical protein